jgi:hypothetical protein
MIEDLNDEVIIEPIETVIPDKSRYPPKFPDIHWIHSCIEKAIRKLIILKINAKVEFGIKPEKYFDEGHNIWR